MKNNNKKITSAGLIICLLAVLFNAPIQTSHAAALTAMSDTMSTVAPAAVANHAVKFTTATTVSAGQTITVTFPAGFVLTGVVFGDVDLLDDSVQVALAATAATTTWGAAVSGQVLTLTSATGTIAAGSVVEILIGTNATNQVAGTHQITNPTAANYSLTVGGTMADSGNISLVIANNVVAVSGTVAQSVSFNLVSSSVALGTLSATTAATGSNTMTVSTNASSGMSVTVAGTTLTSGANTITACATGCSSITGTPQFGLNMALNTAPAVGAAPSGSAPIGTAATNYNTPNNFRFVTGEPVATSAAAINTTTYTASYLANIAGTTPAGSYATNLTYVATSNF